MYETVSAKTLTSIKIGGNVRVKFIREKSDLLATQEPSCVLGRGTNILFCERVDFPILVNRLYAFSFVGERLVAESGVPLPLVCMEAKKRGLSGLEWASGIPGSVGGAVKMNAGAFGSSISEVLERVTVIKDGKTEDYHNSDCGFSYRSSKIDGFVFSAEFALKRADREEIERKTAEYRLKRLASQPSLPSAGCVFRNGEKPAGWYIDNAGLKGEREGDAVVSSKHANFIVNEGNATARQVVALMERIEKRVYALFGVKLQREIKIVGEN